MSQRVILLSFIFLCLAGCSVFAVQPTVPDRLVLLPPNEGPEAVLLTQKVTINAQGEQHQFMVVIRLERQQLKLRALLPTGQPMLSLDYDGKSLQQSSSSPLELPSEEILAMMQFALWPIDSINKHYPQNNGWQLDVIPDQRTLRTTAGVLLSVHYLQAENLMIENHRSHYQVMIETLESKAL